jgi:hypothetical protein
MGQPTKLYAAFCASYWMKKLPKHRIQSRKKSDMSKPKLLRDVIVVVAAKVVLLIAAGVFVFGPANRPDIDSASVESRLIESGPPSPSRSSTP